MSAINRHHEKVEPRVHANSTAAATVTVPCPLGMHMRVCALVVIIAKKFQSSINLRRPKQEADAKSILGIMSLGLRQGETFRIEAQGFDAHNAVTALTDLFTDVDTLCVGE